MAASLVRPRPRFRQLTGLKRAARCTTPSRLHLGCPVPCAESQSVALLEQALWALRPEPQAKPFRGGVRMGFMRERRVAAFEAGVPGSHAQADIVVFRRGARSLNNEVHGALNAQFRSDGCA